MSNNSSRRAAAIRRRRLTADFEPKRVTREALLGDATGLVPIAGETNRVWARLLGDQSQPIKVRDFVGLANEAANRPIQVEGLLIRGKVVDWYALGYSLRTTYANDPASGPVPRHNHPAGNIFARALTMLRAQATDPPSLQLTVLDGWDLLTAWQYFAGGLSPAFIPPVSGTRIDALCIDSTGALTIVTDAATRTGSVGGFGGGGITVSGIGPGFILLALVTLTAGQTEITESSIVEARSFLTRGGGTFVTGNCDDVLYTELGKEGLTWWLNCMRAFALTYDVANSRAYAYNWPNVRDFLRFLDAGDIQLQPNGGRVSIGLDAALPTAFLTLPASDGAASNAPLKIDPGTLLATPEDGAIEFDGTDFWGTIAGVRTSLTAGGGGGASGPAGGDLDGTYPNPRVVQWFGVPLDGSMFGAPGGALTPFFNPLSGNWELGDRVPGHAGTHLWTGQGGSDPIAWAQVVVRTTLAGLAALDAEDGRIAFVSDDDGGRFYVASSVAWYAVGPTFGHTHAGGGGIEIREVDSAPDVTPVTTLVVPNGSLTDDGGGQVTLAITGGTDSDAVHLSVPAEIDGLASKATPVGADELIIEDSADSFNKKKILISDLPGGGSGDVATDPIWDTLGDIAVGTGADTAVVVPVGTDGQVLTADSGAGAGMSWQTPAGGGGGGAPGADIALCKTYTLSPTPSGSYHGETTSYSMPSATPWATPTNGLQKLTDGRRWAAQTNGLAVWVGFPFSGSAGDVVIRLDLDAAYAGSIARATGLHGFAAIHSPSNAQIEYSDDDAAWTVVENRSLTDLGQPGVLYWDIRWDVSGAGAHRYWRCTLHNPAGSDWIFMDALSFYS